MRMSDWSSDVCSSDLPEPISLRNDIRTLGKTLGDVIKDCEGKAIYDVIEKLRRAAVKFRREGNIKDGRILERQIARLEDEQASSEIGRASCRERVCKYV